MDKKGLPDKTLPHEHLTAYSLWRCRLGFSPESRGLHRFFFGRVGKSKRAADGIERYKYVEASRTMISRSLDQHAKPYRAATRAFHCPMARRRAPPAKPRCFLKSFNRAVALTSASASCRGGIVWLTCFLPSSLC